MGLWDKLKGELIDIIEWLDSSNDTMVYRFERHGNEIKNGAKLTVREGQAAVFVNEGQIADVFEPGMYELRTENMPLLSTLKGWKYGFESPFKAEVYFVSTRQFTNQKWGTKNPIMLRDAEFGPIRLRAFGSYAIKIDYPAKFLKEIVGTSGHFTTDEVSSQLRNMIITRFTDILGESKIPALDLAANYNEFGDFVTDKLKTEFEEYGLAVLKLLVENISLPPAVEAALDKRSTMGVLGDLNKYTQLQAADAIGVAAANPGSGGLAGGAMGMGMGFAMANQMGGAMNQAYQGNQQAPQGGPPPPPAPAAFHVAINGQTTGPFDLGELARQAQSGVFTRESLVWKAGMAGWVAASQVPELANVFGPPPPPPPPPPPAPGA